MQLTGAQIIIECLKEQRTTTLFGYPGGTVLSVYDALYERGKGIRHVLTTHEQGAAHAADGYARATGKTGVCLVTSGPGATNLVTGIATAYMDSSPVVAITINVPVASLGRDSFQEIDIAGITMPVTKHNFIVKDVTCLAEVIRRAFLVASSGRPGPVLVDIAKDVTENVCEYKPLPKISDAPCKKGSDAVDDMNGSAKNGSGAFDDTDSSAKKGSGTAVYAKWADKDAWVSEPGYKTTVGKIATAFLRAKRPLIIAGGGCIRSGAGSALTVLAEEFCIPVVDTMMGRGAIPGSNPYSLGMGGEYGTAAAVRAMKDSDLMIAVGCRFSDRLMGDNGEFLGEGRLVHIDIDKAELNKNVNADIVLQSDADTFFRELLSVLKKRSADRKHDTTKWTQSLLTAVEKKKIPSDDAGLTGDIVAGIVGEMAGSEAIYVTEVGECQISAVNSITYERPGSLITSGGLGTMGFGLGAAIGAKAGCPERTVINFAGDGSFRMNMAEIMTAVTNGLPVIEIVFDNGILGMVHTMQKERFSGRYIATDLDDTYNYAEVARSLKAKAFDCSTVKELKAAVREALKDKKKNVCVIVCHIH